MPEAASGLLLPPTAKGFGIRGGRDQDAPGFIALIGRCWADYPGCVLDVDAEAPELRALATHYQSRGGLLWAAGGVDGHIDGMIATVPLDDGAWEICRVYVHPRLHGRGLGRALLGTAERRAIAAGARELILWTDTRFHRAHRFYEKWGYVRNGAVRDLHDIANTTEYQYAKDARTAG